MMVSSAKKWNTGALLHAIPGMVSTSINAVMDFNNQPIESDCLDKLRVIQDVRSNIDSVNKPKVIEFLKANKVIFESQRVLSS